MNLQFEERELETLKADGDYTFEPVFSESLPTISIVSEDGKNDFVTQPNRTEKWDYTKCTVSITGSEEKYLMSEVSAGVKVRGNYTANYDKKPLRIKFDKKQAMLGLNHGIKQKSWVLLAEVKDQSLLRNLSAFYLGHRILGSDGYYVTDFRPVRVEINGQFWGVYLLVEQQENKDGRVNVPNAEEGYTGNDIGYFAEYDGYYSEEGPDGDPTFELNYHNWGEMNGPNGKVWPSQQGYTLKSDIFDSKQADYAGKFLECVYDVAYEATKGKYYDINPSGVSLARVTGNVEIAKHINKYIDLNSLVDTYLLQEITCDPDIGWSSFYLDFDLTDGADHRVRFEAPWDYDSALGNRAGFCEDGDGYYAYGSSNPWLTLLTGQSFFQEMVKAKWAKLVETDSFSSLFSWIHRYSNTYEEEYAENYTRWPGHLGYNHQTAGELREDTRNCASQKQCASMVSDWLGDRLTYLSRKYGNSEEVRYAPSAKPTLPQGYESVAYEAEGLFLFGRAGIANKAGASGGKVVTLEHASSGIRIENEGSEEREVYLSLVLPSQINTADISPRYEVRVGGTPIDIGVPMLQRRKGSSSAYVEAIIANPIDLPEGSTTIEIRGLGKAFDIDQIRLYSKTK